MGQLEFCDKHNMVAILEKTEENTDFHQIIDFLNRSYIKYALTETTTVYSSIVHQFWTTAALDVDDNGYPVIKATIDMTVQVLISEASVRRHLKLDDADGISSLPNEEIFAELAQMRYVTASTCLTFNKGSFSP